MTQHNKSGADLLCTVCGYPAHLVEGTGKYSHDLPDGIRYSDQKVLFPQCWGNAQVGLPSAPVADAGVKRPTLESQLTGPCKGEPCWLNPETGYMEYCREHEGQVADIVMDFEKIRRPELSYLDFEGNRVYKEDPDSQLGKQADAYMNHLEFENTTLRKKTADYAILEERLHKRGVAYEEVLCKLLRLETMLPAVVTSDCGVVEGIFTSWEAAFEWANRHQMNESNIRGGAPFHDVQFPSSAASGKDGE